jgi:hypothetical protein
MSTFARAEAPRDGGRRSCSRAAGEISGSSQDDGRRSASRNKGVQSFGARGASGGAPPARCRGAIHGRAEEATRLWREGSSRGRHGPLVERIGRSDRGPGVETAGAGGWISSARSVAGLRCPNSVHRAPTSLPPNGKVLIAGGLYTDSGPYGSPAPSCTIRKRRLTPTGRVEEKRQRTAPRRAPDRDHDRGTRFSRRDAASRQDGAHRGRRLHQRRAV